MIAASVAAEESFDPEENWTWELGTKGSLADGRVNFVAEADYTENASMDILLKGILGRIARNEGYRPPR